MVNCGYDQDIYGIVDMDLLNFDPATLGVAWIVGFVIGLAAIFHIVQADTRPLGKAIWVAIVLFANWVGLVLWLILGPRSERWRR